MSCECVCVCVFTCVSVCVCENSVFLGGGRGVFSAVVIAFYFLCVHVFILNVCSLIDLCVMALMECVCVCVCACARTRTCGGVGVFLGMYMSACCVQIYLCIFKF